MKISEKMMGAIQILFALLIVVLVFESNNYIKEFSAYGYLGIFVISAISSATLFIPAPSWVLVISIGRVLDPYLVGIVAGVGSSFGEITGYLAGRGTSHMFHTNEHFKKWKELIRKNDLLAVGFLSFVPNPLFDIAGIAAGSLGISIWRYIFACAVGRTLRYLLLAYIGAFSTEYL